MSVDGVIRSPSVRSKHTTALPVARGARGAQVTPGSRSQRAMLPAAPEQTAVITILSQAGVPHPKSCLLCVSNVVPLSISLFRT